MKRIKIVIILLFLTIINCDWIKSDELPMEKSIVRWNNLSTAEHRQNLTFAVLLPENAPQGGVHLSSFGLAAIDLAVQALQQPGHLFENFTIHIEYRNTGCSSTMGPLAAFELVYKHKPHAFFGPTCDYVLAPISRYCSIWKIPILTTGGLAEAFTMKKSYPTLTRMMGSYGGVGFAIQRILLTFDWTLASLLHHDHDEQKGIGHSDCYHTLSGVYKALRNNQSVHQSFDEDDTSSADLKKMLHYCKENSRSKF